MTTPSPAPLLPLTDHAGAVLWLGRDPALADLTTRVGSLPVLSPTPDPFGTLVRSVAGQQLSVQAAASIYARIVERLGEVTPGTLLEAPPEDLRGLGLSWAKVRTVCSLAQAARGGRVDFAHLETLTDEDVIARLTPLPGIGRWTVEMFLMFGLARPDVFSFGDLVLRQELERLHPGASSREERNEIVRAWSPHRTLASRYLWAEKARRRLAAGAGTVTGDLSLPGPL